VPECRENHVFGLSRIVVYAGVNDAMIVCQVHQPGSHQIPANKEIMRGLVDEVACAGGRGCFNLGGCRVYPGAARVYSVTVKGCSSIVMPIWLWIASTLTGIGCETARVKSG